MERVADGLKLNKQLYMQDAAIEICLDCFGGKCIFHLWCCYYRTRLKEHIL